MLNIKNRLPKENIWNVFSLADPQYLHVESLCQEYMTVWEPLVQQITFILATKQQGKRGKFIHHSICFHHCALNVYTVHG